MNKEREWLIEYLKDTIEDLKRVKKPNYISGDHNKCIEEIKGVIELIRDK